MFSGLHVVDGGLGVEMMRRGIIEQGDPLWSANGLVHNPDDIRALHRSYLQSGANIILTASYQASVPGFCRYANCSENEARNLIKTSVVLAKQACADFLEDTKNDDKRSAVSNKLFVGGSVGPYGACLGDLSEYHGSYVDNVDIEEIKNWHRPRIEILVQAGIDFLAIETIPSMREAEAILDVVKEFPNTSCWVTFSCKDEDHTCYGETFYDAATTVAAYDQVEAVGVNCTSPDYIQGLLSRVNKAVCKPLVICPNAHSFLEQYNMNTTNDSRPGAKPSLSSYVPHWLKQGATIIGGCCGATPKDILDIKNAVMECTVLGSPF